ncbi:MAG: hypothetical protein D6696_18095 [Acidobacteria bacterium]|nr:MAG: hypothetical protein D6696_18095 [Acidobacteriota bacterium]
MSHFLLMVTYAALVSVFFALLWRETPRARWRLFLQLFLGMVGGGLLLAWVMYAFPSGPPAPIP